MLPFLRRLARYFSRRAAQKSHKKVQTAPAVGESKPSAEKQPEYDLQREIRRDRKFTLAEAIGREGGSFMKGDAAIPRPLRATTAINQFITAHLNPSASALSTTLFTWASTDIRVSQQLDTPLVALAQIVESLLNEPTTFYEFARQVAIAQSKLTGDRPHFQQPDQPSHPDADYTHESIKAELQALLTKLKKAPIETAQPATNP